ncbi:MAG: GGDEF domain-containing protein [Rhodospirillales bacterium]|nr:GGDEF domain-containing protein [Alphaproteobacteria bacterium]MCB9986568.1 GGDEF domain-containing protein [Rhodospirillales bacterium]USO06899.1 MAG: GGDEF domain-containing protein [Rhodospirillales bacterium]
MSYNHSPTKAREFADKVMERLDSLELPPIPVLFELWYVYESGEDAEITRAIDIMIKGGHELTEERCIELHNKYLNINLRSEEALSKAEGLVAETITNVSSAASAVHAKTETYSDQMAGVAGNLAQAKSPEEMKTIAESMMAQAKKMVEENRALETRLTQSASVMQQLREEMETVRKEAMTDALTGIANRKLFDAEFYRLVSLAHVDQKPLSLLMVDIDYFKSFNDNYGHQVGDQVLKLVARTLKDGVKGRDLPARYGGEEFAVVLPETQLEDAIKVANALREAVAAKEILNRATGARLGRITMSVGAALLGVNEKTSELIERADAALYKAKGGGRNQVVAAPSARQKRVSVAE